MCLGTVHHVIGNVCFELVYLVLQGPVPARVDTLFQDIQEQYVTLQVPHDRRLGTFKLENFTDKNSPHQQYPVLKQVKAAETKALVAVIYNLCKKYQDGSPHSDHRIACLGHLKQVYNIIETADIFLTDEQRSAFRKHMFSFLAHYAWLAFETAEAGRFGLVSCSKFSLLLPHARPGRLHQPSCDLVLCRRVHGGAHSSPWACLLGRHTCPQGVCFTNSKVQDCYASAAGQANLRHQKKEFAKRPQQLAGSMPHRGHGA